VYAHSAHAANRESASAQDGLDTLESFSRNTKNMQRTLELPKNYAPRPIFRPFDSEYSFLWHLRHSLMRSKASRSAI
jgi:hypothetical protein